MDPRHLYNKINVAYKIQFQLQYEFSILDHVLCLLEILILANILWLLFFLLYWFYNQKMIWFRYHQII